MKTVLVEVLHGKALITRLDVKTALESCGADSVHFENTVDHGMQRACENAVKAARTFLAKYAFETIQGKSLRVTCSFPQPAAEYNDGSVSPVVGLKVVGDILNFEIQPHILITGEVDASGALAAVGYIQEKLQAAAAHPEIQAVYLPKGNSSEVGGQLDVCRVESLFEALQLYYGAQLQKHFPRRKFLTTAAIVAGASLLTSVSLPSLLGTYANLFNRTVTEHDWRVFEKTRELYQKAGDYQGAIKSFTALVNKCQQAPSTKEAMLLQAYALGNLGIITLQQNDQFRSFHEFSRARELLASLHANEDQAEMLIRLGEVYRYAVAVNGVREYGREGVNYYTLAKDMLTPAMKRYARLRGKCEVLIGFMHYCLGNYDLAEKYAQEGNNVFDEPETNWTYQTAQQHLARILIKTKKFDQAYLLLERTANSGVLQSPHDHARSLWTWTDFYLTTGDREAGLEYALQAEEWCQKFGLRSQQRCLHNILTMHNLPIPKCCSY